MYPGPMQDIIAAHGLNCMIYSDDTQMYIKFSASERQVQLQKLELCIKDIRTWSVENKLLLNDAKTEVIHISSRFKIPWPLSHVTVGTSQIETVSEARNLDVVIHDSLKSNQHINSVRRSAMHDSHSQDMTNPPLSERYGKTNSCLHNILHWKW